MRGRRFACGMVVSGPASVGPDRVAVGVPEGAAGANSGVVSGHARAAGADRAAIGVPAQLAARKRLAYPFIETQRYTIAVPGGLPLRSTSFRWSTFLICSSASALAGVPIGVDGCRANAGNLASSAARSCVARSIARAAVAVLSVVADVSSAQCVQVGRASRWHVRSC